MYKKVSKNPGQWYTLGCITSDPTAHVSKDDKPFQTVWVKLFGGLDVSALAGTQEVAKGMYVGVKITPKKDGPPTYNVFLLNDDAKKMITGAAAYITPDEPELPF